MSRILITTLIWILIDLYCFQAFKTVTNSSSSTTKSITIWTYWLFDILLIATIIISFSLGLYSKGPTSNLSWQFGLMILSLAPKLILLPFLLIEDITRLISVLINWISSLTMSKETALSIFTGRRKFISQIGIGLAAIPFIGIIYGITKGKHEYRVHKVKLAFKDLPDAFHGFTITQLSDIHSGSFTDQEAVQKGVDIANAQKSDLFVFTGDLVNTDSSEMDNWIDVFSQLKAPHGQFSILGNHDYGDYRKWDSEEEKNKNFERLLKVHEEIGFQLLLNENVKIQKGDQSISLVGVENWGKRGFHQYGDLDKALGDIGQKDFTVLLSHDPSHWEAKTLPHDNHIHLTLSGHTHGMQFGIEIPGFKWSPIKYIYPQWAGAYEKKDKYIYVNRGFGFLGFPGRVGILPEITVIELVKA